MGKLYNNNKHAFLGYFATQLFKSRASEWKYSAGLCTQPRGFPASCSATREVIRKLDLEYNFIRDKMSFCAHIKKIRAMSPVFKSCCLARSRWTCFITLWSWWVRVLNARVNFWPLWTAASAQRGGLSRRCDEAFSNSSNNRNLIQTMMT